MKINYQSVKLWSKIVGNTAPEGILHMAMRHTAHNLSDMVARPFEVDNLYLETIPVSQLAMYADDPEAETVGVYLLIGDDLVGEAILFLPVADAMYLTDWLLETRPGTTTQLDDLECSALAEFGNLTLSSFLNAVASCTGTPLRLSPPAMMVDMLATVFEAIIMSIDPTTDELMVIKTDFKNIESDLSIQFWVIPDPAILTIESA